MARVLVPVTRELFEARARVRGAARAAAVPIAAAPAESQG